MKKSFCDICGIEDIGGHDFSSHGFKRIINIKEMEIIVVIEFSNNFLGQPDLDICKKCARELLDKIEL